MEIKFSGKEVSAMVLREAQKMCAELNTVETDNYRDMQAITVLFVPKAIETEK